jgi:secondary thiamine-phosphate synthase enzyme
MISRISVFTRNKEALEEITHRVGQAVARSGVQEGMCYLFVPHTTAGVLINENADPSVARDILSQFEAMVPSKAHYQHLEGNAPAHIKASIVGTSVTVPVEKGRLALGRWQGIFLAEFDGPRERDVVVQVIGAPAVKRGETPERKAGQP